MFLQLISAFVHNLAFLSEFSLFWPYWQLLTSWVLHKCLEISCLL